MGRCVTPSHRVEYTKVLGRSMFTSAAWRSAAKYGAPGMGRPTVANLAAHVYSLNASMLPGGCNAHIAESFGPTVVLAARIVHQASGEVVAEWIAPAATEVLLDDFSDPVNRQNVFAWAAGLATPERIALGA